MSDGEIYVVKSSGEREFFPGPSSPDMLTLIGAEGARVIKYCKKHMSYAEIGKQYEQKTE